MSLDSYLLLGTTIVYIGLQVFTNFTQMTISANKGPSNLATTFIWFWGIFLFLKRYKLSLVQNIENNVFRSLVQVSCFLIAYEFLLGAWACVQHAVLKLVPDTANYIVQELLGIDDLKISYWPFVILLWILALYGSHFANNADIIFSYYLRGDEADSVDVAHDSKPSLGTIEETVTRNSRLRRSKYTYSEEPSLTAT